MELDTQYETQLMDLTTAQEKQLLNFISPGELGFYHAKTGKCFRQWHIKL